MNKEIPRSPNPEEQIATQPHHTRMMAVLAFGVVLALLIMGYLGYALIVGDRTAEQPASTLSPTATPSATPTATPTVAPTAVPGGQLFTSQHLGISFSYAATAGGQSISVKEVGDTVYVYPGNSPDTTGQSVQVLTKDPGDSIQQAITKLILKGYIPADCPIDLNPNSAKVMPSANSRPVSFQTAEIHWTAANLKGNFVPSDPSKCPGQYVAVNSIRYFLMDQDHPGKLLFFDIGQQVIPASTNLASKLLWQDTVRVF